MKDKQPKKPMGRPVGSTKDNPMTARMLVMVTPDKLATYKQAAKASGSNFSTWVRACLDKGAKE